jgi:SAM-dependent methyltransferase
MHPQQKEFFKSVKAKFPNRFINCDVLDIGSLDINGNNRYLFDNYTYTGVDIGEGNNVDVVSKGHEYKPSKQFDVVISSECFEHDMFYKETLLNCAELLKSGGMFLFSCASTGRKEHGTLRTRKDSSPHTTKVEDWQNYYKNLTEDDIKEVLDMSIFSEYYFEYNPSPCDLYFYGFTKCSTASTGDLEPHLYK